MRARTVLVTGGSGTGKSTVRRELARRGVSTVDGDGELAYQGDLATGTPLAPGPGERPSHWNHLWDVARATEVAARQTGTVVFCGDARNLNAVLHLFDVVVVLQIDEKTLLRRLGRRPAGEFGATRDERELVLRLHEQTDRWPSDAVVVDATRPVFDVVDDILALT
ncbi:MAG: AAA family ATPase [Gordonia paraffinivorans]